MPPIGLGQAPDMSPHLPTGRRRQHITGYDSIKKKIATQFFSRRKHIPKPLSGIKRDKTVKHQFLESNSK